MDNQELPPLPLLFCNRGVYYSRPAPELGILDRLLSCLIVFLTIGFILIVMIPVTVAFFWAFFSQLSCN